jgi:hypothetical protein
MLLRDEGVKASILYKPKVHFNLLIGLLVAVPWCRENFKSTELRHNYNLETILK